MMTVGEWIWFIAGMWWIGIIWINGGDLLITVTTGIVLGVIFGIIHLLYLLVRYIYKRMKT